MRPDRPLELGDRQVGVARLGRDLTKERHHLGTMPGFARFMSSCASVSAFCGRRIACSARTS